MKITQGNSTAPAVYEWALTADAAEFEAAIDAVYQANKAQLTLDGYAAGEVPRAAMETAHGAEYFYYEAINHLLSQGADALLGDAIAALGVTPLTAPDYDVTHCGKDGLCLRIAIGVLPEVTLGQYTGLTLQYPSMRVCEDTIDAQLSHIQQQVSAQSGEGTALPALDDAFAQKVSDCATMDELRAKLGKSLAEFADAQARKQGQFMLLEKIGQGCTVELPEYLLKKEYDTAMGALARHLQQHAIPFETYLHQQGKTKESFEAEHHQGAISALRAKLAAYTIAQKEGIGASEIEIESELIRISQQYQKSVPEFKAEHPAYLVKNDLVLHRTIVFLTQNNTLVAKSEAAN